MNTISTAQGFNHLVSVPAGTVQLEGHLTVPAGAQGVVLFAHSNGHSRPSPLNQYIAKQLQQAGLATLSLNLLTPAEAEADFPARQFGFDIDLLTSRLVGATDWLRYTPSTQNLGVGYLGSNTGSAAALMASIQRPHVVQAIVSQGGRPDLAVATLTQVKVPTLLIVGGHDWPVIAMNQYALSQLDQIPEKRLEVVPEATHQFAEAGALEQVTGLASEWFTRFLKHHK